MRPHGRGAQFSQGHKLTFYFNDHIIYLCALCHARNNLLVSSVLLYYYCCYYFIIIITIIVIYLLHTGFLLDYLLKLDVEVDPLNQWNPSILTVDLLKDYSLSCFLERLSVRRIIINNTFEDYKIILFLCLYPFVKTFGQCSGQ